MWDFCFAQKSAQHRQPHLVLAMLCIILWGSGECMMRVTADAATAGIAHKISGIGFCLLPAPFLHFALVFTEQKHWLQRRWVYPVIYAPGILFAILHTSGYITRLVHLPSGFAPDPHTGFVPYVLWLELFFVAGLYFCYRRWREAKSQRQRKQAAFVIFGVSIPLLIGSVNDALLPLAGVEMPRLAVIATNGMAILIAYAIARFQLMANAPETIAATVLNTMGDLAVVTDLEGKVIFTNDAFRRLVLREGADLERLHLKDFIEEGPNILAGAVNLDARKPASNLVEAHYKTWMGWSFPVFLSISPIYEQGEAIGFVFLAHDVTDRKMLQRQMEELARQHTEDLRTFATSIQRVQEEERQRMARELHDDLGQRLTGMKLHLQALEADIPQTNSKTNKELKSIMSQIDMMMHEIRRIASNLRPTVLDDFGLVVALQLLCKEIQKLHSFKIRFQAEAIDDSHDEYAEIAIYRIVQEALSNITKQAGASSVSVRLSRREKAMALVVTDNGKGFEPENIPRQEDSGSGLGLLDMKERAELLGGSFRIDSALHRGTTINVVIPFNGSNAHEKNQNSDRR
ncbi:MAG: histidine kinase [bacterium]